MVVCVPKTPDVSLGDRGTLFRQFPQEALRKVRRFSDPFLHLWGQRTLEGMSCRETSVRPYPVPLKVEEGNRTRRCLWGLGRTPVERYIHSQAHTTTPHTTTPVTPPRPPVNAIGGGIRPRTVPTGRAFTGPGTQRTCPRRTVTATTTSFRVTTTTTRRSTGPRGRGRPPTRDGGRGGPGCPGRRPSKTPVVRVPSPVSYHSSHPSPMCTCLCVCGRLHVPVCMRELFPPLQ